ncbi:hypothetical protein Mettu_2241 [Methylobacter tundripaludum SV96]|uniref:Uncharacterized protein n=1 Tax=Methylobacter tundripaludum (strain ATCC BAA-1195 / DSM 17260 / SV96) TaxID=697282 RepID=G3IXI2_METTV|nr:hypothetical protein Mettu_2241 [Methylobacter tundripaludum SV96]
MNAQISYSPRRHEEMKLRVLGDSQAGRNMLFRPERKAFPRSHALRGNAVKARCAASRAGQQAEIQSISKQDAARPILHSHAARGNETIFQYNELNTRFT